MVFLELSTFSGLLRSMATGETMPLIKGGGPFELIPCDGLLEVGLITVWDISGGGPSGLTEALADRAPGGDVSLLGLRDTMPVP